MREIVAPFMDLTATEADAALGLVRRFRSLSATHASTRPVLVAAAWIVSKLNHMRTAPRMTARQLQGIANVPWLTVVATEAAVLRALDWHVV